VKIIKLLRKKCYWFNWKTEKEKLVYKKIIMEVIF
jgi:hypothetical protein